MKKSWIAYKLISFVEYMLIALPFFVILYVWTGSWWTSFLLLSGSMVGVCNIKHSIKSALIKEGLWGKVDL